MKKDKVVVISDLHADTWSDDKNIFGKTKLEHFFDFLDWIEPFASTLVINGDLLDAPPAPNTDILPTYEKVILRLAKLAQGTRLYYFIGNHDIGCWGLKLTNFMNIDIAYSRYPHLIVQPHAAGDTGFLYFEHGHFYDPVLNLYIHNAVTGMNPFNAFSRFKDKLRGLFGSEQAKNERLLKRAEGLAYINYDVLRAAQRRDPKKPGHRQSLGIQNRPESWEDLETYLWKRFEPLITEYYTPFHWQRSAQRVFTNFCRDHADAEIKAIIFGHTHMPDEKVLTCDGRRSLYLNSGDWAEPVLEKEPDTHHASFIVFDNSGEPERDPRGRAVRDFLLENYAPDPPAAADKLLRA